MEVKLESAKLALEKALKEKGLCVWPVNEASDAYKLGLFWGITLSWPGPKEKITQQINDVDDITTRVAKEQGLKQTFENPTFAAGGALVVYCGFETYLLEIVRRRAKERNKAIHEVAANDTELVEVKNGEIVAA